MRRPSHRRQLRPCPAHRHVQHVGVPVNDRIPLQVVKGWELPLELAGDAHEHADGQGHAHGAQARGGYLHA